MSNLIPITRIYDIYPKYIGRANVFTNADMVAMLDKIRAEIEQRKKNSGREPNRDLAFNVCLKIIDKYREDGE